MKASEKLIAAIKQFEGCKLWAYRDSGGVPTIGYGHTKNVKMGMAISKDRAEKFLREDLVAVEDYLNKLGICKTQGQFDALCDWCFNLGTYRLTHGNDGKPTTLYNKIVAKASTADIQAQFRRWVYDNGKKLEGLVKRRNWEAQRWAE